MSFIGICLEVIEITVVQDNARDSARFGEWRLRAGAKRTSERADSSAGASMRVLHIVPSLTVDAGMLDVVENYRRHIPSTEVQSDYLYFHDLENTCQLVIQCSSLIIFDSVQRFGLSKHEKPEIVLLCGMIVSTVGGAVANALLKSINSMVSTVVSALVNVLIGNICISFMGIRGAVISVYLSYVVLALYRQFNTRKHLSIDYGGWRFFANAIVVTVQACCVSAGLSTAFVSPITLLFFVAISWCFISKLLGCRVA